MTFSDHEVMAAWELSGDVGHGLEGMRRAMTRAVELVAASGVDELRLRDALSAMVLAVPVGAARDDVASKEDVILAAFSARGAHLAVAQKDRDDARDLYRQETVARQVAQADLERVALELDTLKAALETATRQNEALKAAGAVLSAHVDKTAGEATNVSVFAITPEMEARGDEAEDLALTKGYDDGIEAMRAACIIAVQEVYNLSGGCVSINDLKAAIEGATT